MVATEKIRADLFVMKDDKFAGFTRKLIPNVAPERVIGVRAPLLRVYAKGLRATSAETEFLNDLPHVYLEENTLHGLLISNMKDSAEILDRLDAFLHGSNRIKHIPFGAA